MLFSNRLCDEYDYEKEKGNMDEVLDELDSHFGERDEDIRLGTNTRSLSKCRNAIKAALHTNRDEITMTQQLIE